MADLFKRKENLKEEDRKTGLWSDKNYSSANERYEKGIKNAYAKNTIKKITTCYKYSEYVMAMFILKQLEKEDSTNTSQSILRLLVEESTRRNMKLEIPSEFEVIEDESVSEEEED